ncbi:hypothetical protein HOY80DRAFT_898102 [Tuber brumale]|nr:hypothetical protein HOY80DRAFT_898102 [Tuber brumale]
MHAKIFLTSMLVTLFTAGVIASPAGLKARDSDTLDSANGALTPLDSVASVNADVGTQSLPHGAGVTPGENDIPVADSGVKARDLEDLEKRSPGCIYATSDSEFRGTTVYFCLRDRSGCYNWNSYWRSNISSFRPDTGTLCRIYAGSDCTGVRSDIFGYPGYGNLGQWNDNMGSFICSW